MRRILLALTCLFVLHGVAHAQATFRIGSGGRLHVNGPVGLTGMDVIVDSGGTARVEPGGQVICSAGTITVNGRGEMIGSAASPAEIQGGSATDRVAITAGPTGVIHLRHFRLKWLAAEGLVVQNGATIERMWDGTFEEPPAGGVLLDLSAAGPREKIPYSINNVGFLGSNATNVKAAASTPVVNVLGNPSTGGSLWGEAFDDDANRVNWIIGLVERQNPAGRFDTVQQALADAGTTTGSILRLRQTPIDEEIDLGGVAGPTIENGLFVPQLPGHLMGNGGIIRNCAIARGGLRDTTAYNCTLFDPDGSVVPSVVNLLGENILAEQGTVGTLPGTHSTPSATSGYFRNAATLDFRLTGSATAAIDAGATQPGFNYDFRMQTRGTSWDIGADEFTSGDLAVLSFTAAFTNLPRKTNDITPVIRGHAEYVAQQQFPPGPILTGFDGIEVALGVGLYTLQTTADPATGDFVFDLGGYGIALTPDGDYFLTATASLSWADVVRQVQSVVEIDTTPPDRPTNVTATPFENTVVLRWTVSPSADILGYHVYRKDPGGTEFVRITTLPVTATEYVDGGLDNGVQYCYRVTAVDDALNEQ